MLQSSFGFTFEQFKEIYRIIEGEPEFSIYFNNHKDEYMIIKYDNKVSFQRCGVYGASGEVFFDSLESLLIADTIDDICLETDWRNITDIIVNHTYQLSDKADFVELCAVYNIIL